MTVSPKALLPKNLEPGQFLSLAFPGAPSVRIQVHAHVPAAHVMGRDLSTGEVICLDIQPDGRVQHPCQKWHSYEISTMQPVEVTKYLEARQRELEVQESNLERRLVEAEVQRRTHAQGVADILKAA